MSPFIYWGAAVAVCLTSACTHENDRPMTPANGTTMTSDPSAPSVDPSVTNTPVQTPNASPGPTDNGARGSTMPGASTLPGAPTTHDGVPATENAPDDATRNGPGAPGSDANGAPVGGLR
jgi:hypothetical protein